jgi:CTP synthase (UTP-ammonia lyase)
VKDLFILGDRNSDFVTHRELDAAIELLPSSIRAHWVDTNSPEARTSKDADGLWVVSGSPYRDDAAVYGAIEAARSSGRPFLGTCGGFQYAVVEFARNVAHITGADHGEIANGTTGLVVDRLHCSLVGEERPVTAIPGTRMHELCGAKPFLGFHWCSFGLAPAFANQIAERGLVFSAMSDSAGVEAIELPSHPFFLATLFQPQVGSLGGKPLHPIISSFAASLSR